MSCTQIEATSQLHDIGWVNTLPSFLQTLQVAAIQFLARKARDSIVGVSGVLLWQDTFSPSDFLELRYRDLHCVVPVVILRGIGPGKVQIEWQGRACVWKRRVGSMVAVFVEGLDIVTDARPAVKKTLFAIVCRLVLYGSEEGRRKFRG